FRYLQPLLPRPLRGDSPRASAPARRQRVGRRERGTGVTRRAGRGALLPTVVAQTGGTRAAQLGRLLTTCEPASARSEPRSRRGGTRSPAEVPNWPIAGCAECAA